MLQIPLPLDLCLLSWSSWATDNPDPNLPIRKNGLNTFVDDWTFGAARGCAG